MTWKSDGKIIMRDYYGGYSNMCKELGEDRLPFSKFTIEVYNELRVRYNDFKQSKKIKK